MRESISNSYVFMIVITIIGVCSIIVISSLSYSKTFKIKNRIIEIIDKYQTYDDTVQSEIDQFLKESGYPFVKDNKVTCPTGRGEKVESVSDEDSGRTAINEIKNFKYCIYRYKTVKGKYYSVVTYMSFGLPLIGDLITLEFPLYGDTKVFSDF